METFFSRYKNPMVLIAILLAQALLLATQVQRPASGGRGADQADHKSVMLLRLWTLSIFTPFERLTSTTGHAIRWTFDHYIDLRHVREENDQYKRELAQRRLVEASLAEDALEAQRLRRLLDFRQHYISSTVVAEVIGTSGSDASRVPTLNKGSKDGLKPDMAVITPDGVVGKLRDVFPGTSQLLLLSDPTSGAGVVLASTRIRAILRGSNSGRVQITNLTSDSRVKPGERVLTSGGDQVYPRGLPVGTIESITPDPEHQPYSLITLKSAANLNQLEEVLVVTATGPSLDPRTQEELAQDVVQHAADQSASRLPTAHDPQSDASQGGSAPAPSPTQAVPGQPTPAAPATGEATPVQPAPAQPPPNQTPDTNPATPKPGSQRPRPPAHSDRFSPGAAPPAADLTPGAPKEPETPKNRE